MKTRKLRCIDLARRNGHLGGTHSVSVPQDPRWLGTELVSGSLRIWCDSVDPVAMVPATVTIRAPREGEAVPGGECIGGVFLQPESASYWHAIFIELDTAAAKAAAA